MCADRLIYTIGHSNHEIDVFTALLNQHGVTAVADVRSQPVSRLHHFRYDALQAALGARAIDYVFLGDELGVRRTESACYVNGRANYERIAVLPAFQAGLDRLVEGCGRHTIAVMCAEKDPLDCHRMILVARHLAARGVEIRHILADGSLESQRDAERRLVRAMRIERTLFEPDLSEEEMIQRAYEKRAGQIAQEAEREGASK